MTCNTKRLIDNDCMKDVVEEMRKKRVHIVIWTETHFEEKHSIEFDKIAQERGYNTYSITRLMRRHDYGSGGVTIMIDKQYNSREVRKSKLEDLIWVRVEVGGERVFVGGAYIVPVTSSRRRKAREIVEEIGIDVARFTMEGQVVVAGDWNCKIGRIASVARGREYDRRNMSSRTDTRGRRIVKLMNESDMVILNGIRGSIARDTFDGPKGRGVIDYIAVSVGVVDKASNIEYWSEMRDLVHTDHCALACTIKMGSSGEGNGARGRGEKKMEKGYSIVGREKSEQFWAWLRAEGEERMEGVVEQMKGAQGDVEKCWEALKDGLIGILNEGKTEAKRNNRRKRKKGREEEKIDEELKELKDERKRMRENIGQEESVRKRMKMIKNKMKEEEEKEKDHTERKNQRTRNIVIKQGTQKGTGIT